MPAVRAGASKWVARTSAAARDYAAGVQAPRRSWQQATAAAEPAYEAGVQDAISRRAFAAGVTRAGDQTWAQGVQAKGIARFAPGVQAAQQKYDQNFAPYRQAIEAINLPARGRRGDPNNLQRVQLIDQALHALRQQIKGGGSSR